MKTLFVVASAALALALGTPVVAEEKAAPTAQQMKMKTCNQDAKAKELKGDERKQFMSACLSGKAPGQAKMDSTPPAERNAACAAKAMDKNGKPLAGAAQSSFMKKCMGE